MILVTGATGYVGNAVVSRLASSGHEVAALVRDTEAAQRRLPRAVALRGGLYSDFIRDAWLMLARESGELALPAGQGLVAPVSRDDVATAVAAAVARSDRSSALYTITGDRALGFDDIVAFYADATAQPLRYRPCSPGDYLASASARLDDPWPQAFTTLCASIAEGRYAATSGDFTALTGKQTESFRDFLARAVPGKPANG